MPKVLDKVIAMRLSSELERELRRRAREDDRSLASWLRRQLRALVAEQPEGTGREALARIDR